MWDLESPFDDPQFQQAFEHMKKLEQEQRARMRVRDMMPLMFETFEYMGLRCGINGTHLAGCGYVQLPLRLRGLWQWFGDIPYDLFDAHGGLTYGVDAGGWIGFDTAHAGDYWPTNALALLLDEEERELLITTRAIIDDGPKPYHSRLWNADMLRAATMQLAESIFALDYPHAIEAGPRRLMLCGAE